MLTRQKIIEEHQKGAIHISPFDINRVGENSVNVRLGRDYLYNPPLITQDSCLYIPGHTAKKHWVHTTAIKWEEALPELLNQNIISSEELEYYSETLDKNAEVIILAPGQMILGHTMEEIGTVGDAPYTTNMYSKSTTVRNMLSVCRDGGQGAPGYKNKWTMEIKNESDKYYIPLVVGSEIAQITFTSLVGKVEPYKGKYNNAQWSPDDMRPLSDPRIT